MRPPREVAEGLLFVEPESVSATLMLDEDLLIWMVEAIEADRAQRNPYRYYIRIDGEDSGQGTDDWTEATRLLVLLREENPSALVSLSVR
mgnify:FL=1